MSLLWQNNSNDPNAANLQNGTYQSGLAPVSTLNSSNFQGGTPQTNYSNGVVTAGSSPDMVNNNPVPAPAATTPTTNIPQTQQPVQQQPLPNNGNVLNVGHAYTSNFADDDDWQTELAKSKANGDLLTNDARILDAGRRIFSTRGFNFQQGFDNKFQRDYIAARLRTEFGLSDKKVKMLLKDRQFAARFLKDNQDQFNWQLKNKDNDQYYGTMGSSYWNYAAKQKAELEAQKQAQEKATADKQYQEFKNSYLNDRQLLYNTASDQFGKDTPLSAKWQELNKPWANTNYFDDLNNDGKIDVNEIKARQQQLGLNPDGMIGEQTIKALGDDYNNWAQLAHESRVAQGIVKNNSAEPTDWMQTENYKALLNYKPTKLNVSRGNRVRSRGRKHK